MLLNISRLVISLLFVFFHRHIADFLLACERETQGYLRSRGMRWPDPPSNRVVRDLYFVLGVFITMASMARMWMAAF